MLNFKTPNFVNISKNRTDKLRILFYFVSILFSIQSNQIVSICSISNRLLQSQSPRRSSSEDGQNPERQRSCSSRGQQCHTHEVQAANERLHAVCQEISCGIHADVPGKRQQVGVNWVCEKEVMLRRTTRNTLLGLLWIKRSFISLVPPCCFAHEAVVGFASLSY